VRPDLGAGDDLTRKDQLVRQLADYGPCHQGRSMQRISLWRRSTTAHSGYRGPCRMSFGSVGRRLPFRLGNQPRTRDCSRRHLEWKLSSFSCLAQEIERLL